MYKCSRRWMVYLRMWQNICDNGRHNKTCWRCPFRPMILWANRLYMALHGTDPRASATLWKSDVEHNSASPYVFIGGAAAMPQHLSGPSSRNSRWDAQPTTDPAAFTPTVQLFAARIGLLELQHRIILIISANHFFLPRVKSCCKLG